MSAQETLQLAPLPSESRPQGNSQEDLRLALCRLVSPLGYDVVHIEVQTHRVKTLRVFIDFLESQGSRGIGIEDCVRVSKSIDEPLDQLPELDAVFKGPYELEVSSPGVDRPLRTSGDFNRFSGREVRIHVFRPLTADELGNPDYQTKNPKQKSFLGRLIGFRSEKVLLSVSPSQGGSLHKSGKKKSGASSKKASFNTNRNSNGSAVVEDADAIQLAIPLPLISKANLEPHFEIEDGNERE